MGAACYVIYYGLRFDVPSGEIQRLEDRTDERIVAARNAGLEFYWGNFDVPCEKYLLFIGAQIGVVGPENQIEVQIGDTEFEAIATLVQTKLVAAGLAGTPRLHIQWQGDS